jgi:hypothetical protein
MSPPPKEQPPWTPTQNATPNSRARWRKLQLKAYNMAIERLDLPRVIEPEPC